MIPPSISGSHSSSFISVQSAGRFGIGDLSSKLFIFAALLCAISPLLPLFLVHQPRNESAFMYEEYQGMLDNLNTGPFINIVLIGVTVAFTLFSDGLLDAMYGSKLTTSINMSQWLLLLSVAIPNTLLYIAYLCDSLTIGILTAYVGLLESALVSALLSYHYGMTASSKVRGAIWVVLISYNVFGCLVTWELYYELSPGLRFCTIFFMVVTHLTVAALTVYRVMALLAYKRFDASKAVDPRYTLGVAYTCCLEVSMLIKAFLTSSLYAVADDTIGVRFSIYISVNIVVMLILCVLHGRISKLESITSSNMLNVKRNFVRYISHEIRTPLNTVAMGLQYVQSSLDCGNPVGLSPAQLETCSMLKEVEYSCDAAIQILNSILTYDKLESGNLVLSTRTVPAQSLLVTALRPFSIEAARLGLRYEFDGEHMAAEVESALLSVDASKISQVLRNLVSNALKFTKEGGSVVVTSQIHSVSSSKKDRPSAGADDSGRELVVSVQDTGVGISKENQHKLFTEIIQFDAADLQGGNGSGLGLWLSNAIVGLHGGRLSMSSSGIPGEGCTFTLHLPILSTEGSRGGADIEQGLSRAGVSSAVPAVVSVVNEPEKAVEVRAVESIIAAAEQTSTFPLPRCVIVDDAPMNRKLLSRLLKSSFKDHVVLENGLEAVNYVTQALSDGTVISAIFMDSIMPVMTGVEASNKIRKAGYTGLLIGVTGNVLKEQIDDFTSNGANAVLPKPVDMKELTRLLKEHFGIQQ